MSTQPVEANVVLTSDNSQYDQAMNQSAATTDRMGQSVDTLGSKISKLTKTAGKSLIGISAADVALIGGATAAWASYEKQMTRLQSQSAILGRTTTEQNKLMKDYTSTVKALRTEYGVTTSEAANLVTTLTKITNMRQSTGLKDLSKVFVDMSEATGESSSGLADSLTNLQKMMGSPINAQSTRKYADQFTYLAAKTQSSAQGLIDFTAQLAPAGKAIGMHHDAIAGWATAFTKAGVDGGPAAQIFTKITNDIAHSLATGSPEIAHYANMLGVTQKQFKELGGDEQLLRLFEKLHSEGKGAATEFARLNLDSVRGVRAVRAVTARGFNLRETIGDATSGDGSPSAGAAKKAADATDNMSRQMSKLHEETKQLAETFGGMFGPAIESFVKGMNKALEVVNAIASGPLGQMIGWVMKIVAPFAAGAGAILLFAGALLKLAGVFALLRNSMAGGAREGFRGGAAIGPLGDDNQYLARGDREMGAFGQKLAGVTSDRPGTWLQRAQYNAGIYGGRAVRGGPGALVSGAQWAWEKNPLTSYTRPVGGAGRGLGSYMAGGLGRAIDMAITPQFDQMRYDDPTKRSASRMLGQVAPWTKIQDRMGYVNALADEHLAGRQINSVAMERSKVAQDPLLSNQARQTRMDELKTIEEETKVRQQAAIQTKTAALEQIEAQRKLATETGSTTTRMRGLRESLIGTGRFGGGDGGGLGGAVGGGLFGAAKAGGKAFLSSGMAYPAAGMAATALVSATGQDSKALQMGAMGLMMGPWGAGIGAVTGAVIDMTQSNKGLEESLQNLKSVTDDFAKSGVGAKNWFDTVQKQQEDLDKTTDSRSAKNMWKSPGNLFGSIWNWGNRNVDGGPQAQDQAAIDAERKRGVNVDAANRALARKAGLDLSGLTPTQQRAKLDDFMSTTGAQRFETAGIDPEQFYAAREKAQNRVRQSDINVTGGYGAQHQPLDPTQDAAKINAANEQAWKAMLDKLQSSKLGPAVEQRISRTVAGQAMADSPAAQRSITHQEDVLAEYKGTQQMFDSLHKQGLSNIQIMHAAAVDMSKIGDSNSQQFKLQYDLFQKSQQTEQMNMPLMTRSQQFQSTMRQMGALENVQPTTPEQKALVEQQKLTTAQGVVDQVQYVKQMLLMQDQYEINRKRAQDDYALQRSNQERDYNIQRSREEAQFNLSRKREIADYHRQVARSNYQFNLSRKRQEEDFNHSTELQAKQMAMSVYNIYERVDAKRTSSANWILANAADQLKTMQQQEVNLKKVREMGLSDAAIQQMHLTDPEQAQQLARLTTELSPSIIKQMNSVIGTMRVTAANALNEDPSNLDRQETLRSYRRSREQALQDHRTSMQWGHDDFMRQLRNQKKDFNLLMANQATDYQTMVTDQEKAYRKSMHRSAVDLANAGKEITGSVEGILKQGATSLTGYAGQAAQAALDTFTGLKRSTRPVAVAIMQDLAAIFGFDYQKPKNLSNNAPYKPVSAGHPAASATDVPGRHPGVQFHEGGVVPGWSPGTDDTMVPLSGGEAIMRPEWARKVGEKNIHAMNHAAKHGGYAGGGIYKPVKGYRIAQGLHDQWTGYPALDLGVPVGSPVYAVESGRITRSEDYPGIEPRISTQNGYRSYGRVMYLATDNGGPTLVYGHLSKRGFGPGTHVSAGQAIGLSGNTGYSFGPHLHFGDSDGNPYEFLGGAAGRGTIHGGIAGVGADTTPLTRKQIITDVMKARYKSAEAAAAALQGAHPLFPGDISEVINRMVKQAVRLLVKKYGAPLAEGAGGGGLNPNANYGGNARGVWNALTAAGFSKVQAAGIMGNMQSESGFDPYIVQGGGHSMSPADAGGGGYGLVQWTPGSKVTPYLHGHKPSVATEINALREQLAGLGPSPEGAAGASLRSARSVAQAARAFELGYERHAGGPQANRITQAQAIYKQYAANGAIVNGARNLVVGEAGPEAVIPLNDRGAEFMNRAMGGDARRVGMGSTPVSGGLNVYNTRIDKSTNFTGPITVQANDPEMLLNKLQARMRVLALSRPALTGSSA